MIKGLYAAVSGMLTNINRQQALAHNVANLNTPGFKQILTSINDFTHTDVVFPPGNITRRPELYSLGNIGLGAQSALDITDFEQGALVQTSSDLDLAIEGDGFFRLRGPDGERLTRDGRFIKDSEGQLAAVDGSLLLDEDGQPIQLEDGFISISEDGVISVDGQEQATIGLAVFEDPRQGLERGEDNTFTAAQTAGGENRGRIIQNHLEMSNANATQLMTQLVDVARSYEAAQQMVSNQDELLGKTINTLGRIG